MNRLTFIGYAALLAFCFAIMITIRIQNPEMTEIQLFFHAWPYWLGIVGTIVCVALIIQHRRDNEK